MTDDELAVARAVADTIPRVAALSGWPNVDWSTIRGLLAAEKERRGLSISGDRTDDLHAEALRLAVPHMVELRKGPWFGCFADFVRSRVHGVCSLSPIPWTDEDLDQDITRYRVWFADRAEAALFRSTFG